MKKIISLFLISLLVLFLSGCGANETTKESLEEDKEIVGSWVSEIDHDNTNEDNQSEMTYTFNEDGTYKLVTVTEIKDENGEVITEENESEGQYTIEDSKLTIKELKENGNTVNEDLQAIDNTVTGEPEKETEEEYSETTYDLSIQDDTLILTLGETTYEFTKK